MSGYNTYYYLCVHALSSPRAAIVCSVRYCVCVCVCVIVRRNPRDTRRRFPRSHATRTPQLLQPRLRNIINRVPYGCVSDSDRVYPLFCRTFAVHRRARYDTETVRYSAVRSRNANCTRDRATTASKRRKSLRKVFSRWRLNLKKKKKYRTTARARCRTYVFRYASENLGRKIRVGSQRMYDIIITFCT